MYDFISYNTMIRPTLAVLAIVAIAAMMGAASVAPVYAAEKTSDVKLDEFEDDLTQRSVCGETLVDVERTTKTRSTIWDNGHYKLHITIAKKFFNQDTGEELGHFTSVSKHTGKDFGVFISQSFEMNESFKCLNGIGNGNDTFGFTVDEDGKVKHRPAN